MALTLKKPLVAKGIPGKPVTVNTTLKASTGAATTTRVTKTKGNGTGDDEPKVVTKSIRLSATHQEFLDAVKEFFECDNSEAFKRGLRFLHTISQAQDAELHLTHGDGHKETVPLVRRGVPC